MSNMQYKKPETVECRLCGKPTPMTGTKLCYRCWEVVRIVISDIELAKKIIKESEDEGVKNWT